MKLPSALANAHFQSFCTAYAKHYAEGRYHSPPAYAYTQLMKEVIGLCSSGRHTSERCAAFHHGDETFKQVFFFEAVVPYLEKHGFPIPDGTAAMGEAFEDFKINHLHTLG
jgi:hypothetical protein